MPHRAVEVYRRLMEGNGRYVQACLEHSGITRERREALRDGQKPDAVILGCADSRVPPEFIFDVGLGELFVIRVAGNVLDEAVLGSIEYAVSQLDCRLVLVLGHEGCGAVAATAQGGTFPGHLPYLIDAVSPAVASARKEEGDLIENAVRINVCRIARDLPCRSDIIAASIGSGKVRVVPAYYHLVDGHVEALDIKKGCEYCPEGKEDSHSHVICHHDCAKFLHG